MALKKELNPAVVAIVIVAVILIIGLLVWRFTGKGAKQDFNPGAMMGKYMPEEAKAKMQRLAPGMGGEAKQGETSAPAPSEGGGE